MRNKVERDRELRLDRVERRSFLGWSAIDTPLLKAKEGFFCQALLALESPRFAPALQGARIAAEPQSVVTLMLRAFQGFRLCRILLPTLPKIASLFFGLLRKAHDVRQLQKHFFQRFRALRPHDHGVNDVRGGGWNTFPALDRLGPGVRDADDGAAETDL